MKHVAKTDHDVLEACIRRHLPSRIAHMRLTRIPTGKFNTGYFVDADGEGFVLRIAPPADSVFLFYERNMMRQEPGLHRLLRKRTAIPVAEVVAFDDTHDLIDRDFILMRRLPGQPLCDRPNAHYGRVMRRVGECLREVHSLTAERYGYLGEHRPMDPQPSWAEAFRVMWCLLIEDVAATGHYDRDEVNSLIALLDRHRALFDRAVPACLLHMDVWAQNILVGVSDELTGLVDWDRALWGDPEIEFAVLDYCGISTPDFWTGYGTPRDESPEARLRNIFYLLYEVQKYIVIRHGRGRAPGAATGYKRQVAAVLQSVFGL